MKCSSKDKALNTITAGKVYRVLLFNSRDSLFSLSRGFKVLRTVSSAFFSSSETKQCKLVNLVQSWLNLSKGCQLWFGFELGILRGSPPGSKLGYSLNTLHRLWLVLGTVAQERLGKLEITS